MFLDKDHQTKSVFRATLPATVVDSSQGDDNNNTCNPATDLI